MGRAETFTDIATSYTTRKVVVMAQVSVMTVLAAFQLVLGSLFSVTAVIWFIACISAQFLLPKMIRPSDVFVYLLGLYCGGCTLIFKSMLLQPLQTNLVDPSGSAGFLFVGFVSVMCASVLAKQISGASNSRISQRMNAFARNNLSLLPVLIAFGFLTRFLFIVIVKGQEGGSSLGAYVNLFQPIYMFALFMAVIHTAKGSQLAKLCLISSVIGGFGVTIIGNVKVEVINMFMVVFFGILFLNLKIRLKYIVTGAVIGFLSVALLVPALQLMRSSLSDIPASQRLAAAWEILEDANFSPSTLARLQAAHFSNFQYSYAPYSSYVYPSTANVDRFMMIFPTDQVVRSLDQPSGVSFVDVVEETAELILPSFMISKDPEALVDLIAWDRGIRANGSIARPVLGLMATSVTFHGLFSIAFIPFVSVFPLLCFANYFFGFVNNCAFGALGCFFMMRLVEKEFERFFFFCLRELPLLWITCIVMLFVIRYTPRSFNIRDISS